MPRRGRRRRQGLSQPQRRRLAVGRHARRRSSRPSRTASAPATPKAHAGRRCRPSAATACSSATRSPTVADYVRSLAGLPTRAGGRSRARARRSSPTTARSVTATTARAIAELGAPNLTDAIWLYGVGQGDHRRRRSPTARGGVMPAWAGRLDDATIKALAVYVHSLGGGEK